jgi:hypothetical protein
VLFAPKKGNKNEKWTFFYSNARGLQSKRTCLVDILTEMKPQMALFTESMLKDSTSMKIDGYSFCGKARSGKVLEELVSLLGMMLGR